MEKNWSSWDTWNTLKCLHVLKKSILAAGTAANQVPKIIITCTKLYVFVVTLAIQDNIKLLKQLGFFNLEVLKEQLIGLF